MASLEKSSNSLQTGVGAEPLFMLRCDPSLVIARPVPNTYQKSDPLSHSCVSSAKTGYNSPHPAATTMRFSGMPWLTRICLTQSRAPLADRRLSLIYLQHCGRHFPLGDMQ